MDKNRATKDCPACGEAELVHDTRDVSYSYKGESIVILGVTGEFCPACDGSVLGAAESERVMGEMRAFASTVNARIVDPGFILRVRKKLGLDQKEAADLFGGGVNAFSRYEKSRAQPPLALVQLLRLLDRHPHLLDELRDGQAGMTATQPIERTTERPAARPSTPQRLTA